MNRQLKFRVWDNEQKKFECFQIWNITVADIKLVYEPIYQFIGILDKNLKEIYEGDVVKFKTDTKEDIGVVQYMNDYCSYVVEAEDGYNLFADITFDSLEVVGNLIEDYMYGEDGELIKKLSLS